MIVLAFIVMIFGMKQPAYADATPATSGALSASCDKLYALPTGTQTSSAGTKDGIDATTCDAKMWLFKYAQPKSGCGTANMQSFAMLNNKFAVCAQKFLQAYGKPFTISSAYRSQSQQVCVCGGHPVAGKCGSAGPQGSNGYALNCSGHWHQCGLAIDVNTSDGENALHAFARQNPQFGVNFPIAGDPVHMMPNGKDCGSDGSGGMTQNYGMNVPTGSQSAPFASTLNNLMGQQQTYNPAASYTASQPLTTTSAQPYTSTGSTGSTVTGGSVSTGSSVPTSGVTTGTSIPTSGTSLGNTSGGLGGNGNYGTTSTSTDASSTDVWNQLLAMSQGSDTNTNVNDNSATGTPVDLNNNLGDSSGLNAPPPDQTQQLPQGQSVIQTSNAPATTSNTFTSPNMTDLPETSSQPSTFGSSIFSQALEKLKLMLLAILDQLKPLLVPFYASTPNE